MADTALGSRRLDCLSLGSASPGARSADEGEVILMSNAWAFTRRELATSGQFFCDGVVLAGWPGRGGRHRSPPLERETGEHGRGISFST